MKIENILKWIGYSLLFIVLVGWGTYYRLSKKDESRSAVSTSSPTETGSKIQYGVKQYITIDKFSPVEISIFNNGRYDNVVIGTDDKDTPYVCHYNKGLTNEDRVVVPAYSDWNKLGFTPKLQSPGMKKVELSLPYSAPMKTAQVYYIFRRE